VKRRGNSIAGQQDMVKEQYAGVTPTGAGPREITEYWKGNEKTHWVWEKAIRQEGNEN